jgi:tRNA(adenine34) deaminase
MHEPGRDAAWMAVALAEAEDAARAGEVPVGAVVVDEGRGTVWAQAHNLRETLRDPTAHAELLAIREAALRRGGWRLEGLTLYVTLEPCVMCAGALVLARVSRLVFGTADPKGGAVMSLYRVVTDERLNHRLEVTAGVRADEAERLLRLFFQARRASPPVI